MLLGTVRFFINFASILELTSPFLGNGLIRKSTLPDLISLEPSSLPNPPHDNTLHDSAVLSLFLVRNERTQEPIVIGGGDDGSIALWELRYNPFFTAMFEFVRLMSSARCVFMRVGLFLQNRSRGLYTLRKKMSIRAQTERGSGQRCGGVYAGARFACQGTGQWQLWR